MHAYVMDSVEKAASIALERPPYKIEILLRQSPRHKNTRFYGSILLYTRGSRVDDEEGVVKGIDSMCGFCARKRTSSTGMPIVCGNIIDHVFLFGDSGYCTVCGLEGKIGEHVAESIDFSFGTLRKLAELIDLQLLARLRTPYFADIYLKRFLASTYTAVEQMKAGDLSAKAMVEKLKKSRVMESVPYLEKQFRKDREAGANPVALLEHYLKA